MIIELVGWGWFFAMLPYGEEWRKGRRAFHQYFNPGAVEEYQPQLIQAARKSLGRFLADPDEFFAHVRHMVTALIMDVAYGIEISHKDDPYIQVAEVAMASISESGMPGAFLVNHIPILKYVPVWFPGAGFQKKAKYWRKVVEDMINKPFQNVVDAVRQGTATPSITSAALQGLPEEMEDTAHERDTIKYLGGIAYVAGIDSTVSTAHNWFLAMAMYPDVQKRAQAVLDEVVGTSRLPDFSDRDRLPYIEAMIMETMRWQVITPLAFPHCSTEDDEYQGYFIPKGSLVFGNAWSILHDPKEYPDPERFNPERFLEDGRINPNVRDPRVAAFGFGRRICPGRFLSDRMMFSLVTSVLSVFDIAPPLDQEDNPVSLKPALSPGIIGMSAPFKCAIKPRSPAAEDLIRIHSEKP